MRRRRCSFCKSFPSDLQFVSIFTSLAAQARYRDLSAPFHYALREIYYARAAISLRAGRPEGLDSKMTWEIGNQKYMVLTK